MKELTMNEMSTVCGGKIEDPEGRTTQLLCSVAYFASSPNYDAMVARVGEMMNDSNVWTYDDAMAELQAIEPSFYNIY